MFYTIAAPRLMTFLHLINAAQPLSLSSHPTTWKNNELSKSIRYEEIDIYSIRTSLESYLFQRKRANKILFSRERMRNFVMKNSLLYTGNK